MYIFIQTIIFTAYSFLAAIVPAGGSLIVNAALSFMVPVQKAIGLTSGFFLINGIIVSIVFWSDISWKEFRKIIIPSVVGALIGAFVVAFAPPKVLIGLLIFFSLKFIYEKSEGFMKKAGAASAKPAEDTKSSKASLAWDYATGFLSGMVQGAGLPGGGIRNSYLLSKGLSVAEMHGTTNFTGIFLFSITIGLLLHKHVMVWGDYIPLLISIPFLYIANYITRKALIKIPKKASDILAFVLISFVTCFYIFLFITK